MERQKYGEGRSRDSRGTQNRKDQCPRDTNSKAKLVESGSVIRGQSRRATGTNWQGATSNNAGTRAETITGGIIRQLINDLLDQRATYETQIQKIDERVADLQALCEELLTQIDTNP